MTAGLNEDDLEGYALAYVSAVDSELKSRHSTPAVLGGQMRGMMGSYGRQFPLSVVFEHHDMALLCFFSFLHHTYGMFLSCLSFFLCLSSASCLVLSLLHILCFPCFTALLSCFYPCTASSSHPLISFG
jgi:hypothetical protein